MNGYKYAVVALGFALAFHVSASPKPTIPPVNQFLADSPRNSIHGLPDVQKMSRVAGPLGKSRRLRDDEIIWKRFGPYETSMLAYSSPYPNGKRTVLLGCINKLVKLDADTLEVISVYNVRKGPDVDAYQAEQLISGLDKLVASGNRDAIYNGVEKMFEPVMRDDHLQNIYGFVTRDNERLFFYKDPDTGKRYLQFYGDAVDNDYSSPIALKRQWEIPRYYGKDFIPFAPNMTYDGWIIVVSKTGVLLAISRDLKKTYTLDLAPKSDTTKENALDTMQSYVRNAIAIDDKGGIYVVSRDFFARVQWTGAGFSEDPKKGAWKITYPPGVTGSGTTPALMGYGPREDHLVVLADGSNEDPHMLVYWRDGIPKDWKGIPGYDRRVAGVAPVTFIDGKPAKTRIENSPAIMGYGIFAAAETPSQPVPKRANSLRQFIAEAIASSLTGSEAIGGVKWVWNPKRRKLETAWHTPLALGQSICTASVNDILYCIGRRDGEFTLEGIDWNTGASRAHWTLGPSMRYFSYNDLVVAPNGSVDLMSWMGMGLVRIQPKLGNGEKQ